MEKLPIYKALISTAEDMMITISLVDYPATESDFVAFAKENQLVKFSVENEEKRLVRGLVMAANLPIYRVHPNFGEYYIVYEPETIRLMAEKYLKDGFQNNVDLMHDGQLVDGVNMVQFFIKDTANGISPKPFEDYDDGSLFAEFHIENNAVWEQIKNGDFKGFSLEGFFTIEPMEFNKQENNNNTDKYNKTMSKLNKIKEMLKSILVEFGTVATDKGTIVWDSDEDLKIGDMVHTVDEEGNEVALEDGDYRTEDGKIIVIADGKVVEIKDVDAEVATDEPAAPTEEPVENAEDEPSNDEPTNEPEPEADEKDELIKQLQAEIERITAENEELKNRIAELEKEPNAPSAEEAFSALEEDENTPIAKMKRRGYRF